MTDEESILRTLRRIPDRIILAVAARDINPMDNSSCLCGWALRESLAEMANMAASDVTLPEHGHFYSDDGCREVFGGTRDEWTRIFGGIVRSPEAIESAYTTRLDEACGFRS